MGSSKSKNRPDVPVVIEPWRKINFEDNWTNLTFVKNYKPRVKGHQIRILLHGPPGAGKSSFINSLQSVLIGRIYRQALVNNSTGCFTKEYATYRIYNDDSIYPFVFNDVMGLGRDTGVLVEDVRLALMGHVKEGYWFSSETPLSKDSPFYNKSPQLQDKVHVLVCVIPADTMDIMSDQVLQKIRNIRMEASRLQIPQLAIITKIDEACPEIRQDLKNVYRMQKLKEQMDEFSVATGIPLNCIFPVKSYHQEIEVKGEMDALILSAMRTILTCGNDFLDFNQNRFELK